MHEELPPRQPPKKPDDNIIDFSEKKKRREEGDKNHPVAGNYTKKIGGLSRRSPEEILSKKEKIASNFVSAFEEKFISSIDNKTQELRRNLYDEKEYIFWINATNFSQDIVHWKRELMDMQIEIEKANEGKSLPTIKTYLKNLSFFNFDGIGTEAGANDDTWFILKKFEELARKFKK